MTTWPGDSKTGILCEKCNNCEQEKCISPSHMYVINDYKLICHYYMQFYQFHIYMLYAFVLL